MKKLIVLGALALLIAIVAIGQPHAYSVPGHQGVVVGDCNYDVGIEFRGDTGIFVNQC